MGKPTAQRGSMIVLLAVVVMFASLAMAVFVPREASAQRRPIPRAANSVDQAAGAFEELCDEVRETIGDYREQGYVDGAFGIYVMGIPLMTVEWRVDLPKKG